MADYKNNADFQNWYKIIRKFEGGISDRPKNEDPGGLTNRGVTYKSYITEKWYKIVNKGTSIDEFLKLTEDETQKIAYEGIWKPYKIDLINSPYKKILAMDSIWGGGGLRSLGVKNIAELNATKLTDKQLIENRWKYMKSLKNFEYNKNGWFNRLNGLLKITSSDFTISMFMLLIASVLLFSVYTQK
jgi:lysozyme family protein